MTGTKIQTIDYGAVLRPRDLDEAIRFSEVLAKSDFVPKDYQRKPGNILVAIQMGAEVGLAPMQAIQNIAVINGRPSLWGDAMLALVMAHPECEGVEEDADLGAGWANCTVRRQGRKPVTRQFTVDEAKQANLWGKNIWKQYPQRMLQMRARSWALRDAFPDALKGLGSAEENRDIVDVGEVSVTDPAVPKLEEKHSASPFEGAPKTPGPSDTVDADGVVNGEDKPPWEAVTVPWKSAKTYGMKLSELSDAELTQLQDFTQKCIDKETSDVALIKLREVQAAAIGCAAYRESQSIDATDDGPPEVFPESNL